MSTGADAAVARPWKARSDSAAARVRRSVVGSGGHAPLVAVVGSSVVVRGGSQGGSQVNGSAGGIPSREADSVSSSGGDGRSGAVLLGASSVGAKTLSVSV